MQLDDSTNKTNLRGNAEEKKDTKVLNDQQNIREIVERHPYKKWEDILDGSK